MFNYPGVYCFHCNIGSVHQRIWEVVKSFFEYPEQGMDSYLSSFFGFQLLAEKFSESTDIVEKRRGVLSLDYKEIPFSFFLVSAIGSFYQFAINPIIIEQEDWEKDLKETLGKWLIIFLIQEEQQFS